jgi:hypothetical protein
MSPLSPPPRAGPKTTPSSAQLVLVKVLHVEQIRSALVLLSK